MFDINKSFGYLFGIISRKISHTFTTLMKDHNIPIGQSGWIVLSRLWEDDGLTQQEIADRSGVAKPNISNYVNDLEEKNYVVRITDESNKRNNHVYLTRKGKDLKESCVTMALQSSEEILQGLTKEETSTLRKLLKKIVDYDDAVN